MLHETSKRLPNVHRFILNHSSFLNNLKSQIPMELINANGFNQQKPAVAVITRRIIYGMHLDKRDQ